MLFEIVQGFSTDGFRCDTRENLLTANCSQEYIYSPNSTLLYIKV